LTNPSHLHQYCRLPSLEPEPPVATRSHSVFRVVLCMCIGGRVCTPHARIVPRHGRSWKPARPSSRLPNTTRTYSPGPPLSSPSPPSLPPYTATVVATSSTMNALADSLVWEHPQQERLRLNSIIFFIAFLCSAGIGLSSKLKVRKEGQEGRGEKEAGREEGEDILFFGSVGKLSCFTIKIVVIAPLLPPSLPRVQGRARIAYTACCIHAIAGTSYFLMVREGGREGEREGIRVAYDSKKMQKGTMT